MYHRFPLPFPLPLGLAKFQAILAQAAAEREAAQAANDDAKAKIAAIKGEMEFLGSYAGEQAEQIKAAEAAADQALTAWQQYTAHIDSERASLKNYNATTKATLTKTKEDLGKELAAAKANYETATGGQYTTMVQQSKEYRLKY